MSGLVSQDRWLSSRESAEYLGVEPSTLAKWRQRGIGPHFSCALGRDPRYRWSELESFMVVGMASNTAEARYLRRAKKA
jgi:hypothetical protein